MKFNWQWCSALVLGVGMSVVNVGCQTETPPADTGSSTSSTEGEGSTTSSETPATETPEAETPATETPATETPTTETPATETPATETPATETSAADEDHEALEAIMEKLAKPPVALNGKIGEALAADPVDWAAVGADILELHTMATQLGDLTPPKGDAESWKTQTAAFLAAAEQLKAACEAQDVAAAQAAHGTIKMSCGPCHMAHKPE